MVRDYHERTAGIPDCFDLIGSYLPGEALDGWTGHTATDLIPMAPLLTEWWDAILQLEHDLAATTGVTDAWGNAHPTPAGRTILEHEITRWLRVRQYYLHSLAHQLGAEVPRPDVAAYGYAVMIDGKAYGRYGYHQDGQ